MFLLRAYWFGDKWATPGTTRQSRALVGAGRRIKLRLCCTARGSLWRAGSVQNTASIQPSRELATRTSPVQVPTLTCYLQGKSVNNKYISGEGVQKRRTLKCICVSWYKYYSLRMYFSVWGVGLLHHASLPPHPFPAPYQHQGESIALLSWRFCSNVNTGRAQWALENEQVNELEGRRHGRSATHRARLPEG